MLTARGRLAPFERIKMTPKARNKTMLKPIRYFFFSVFSLNVKKASRVKMIESMGTKNLAA